MARRAARDGSFYDICGSGVQHRADEIRRGAPCSLRTPRFSASRGDAACMSAHGDRGTDPDFLRAVEFAATNLHDDKERYKAHPIKEVRDRIDEIRAQRGLSPFRGTPRRDAAFSVGAWIDGSAAVHPFVQRLRDVDYLPTPEPAAPRTATPPQPPAAAGAHPAYVSKVVAGELAKLAAAAEGCRNDSLARVAFRLFELAKGGHIDAARAADEMRRLSAASGLPDSEIEATLRSAWSRTAPKHPPAATGISAYTLDPKDHQ
ncbi:MAG: hypothetical protein ACRDT5_16110 [Mycobacterium sp.]